MRIKHQTKVYATDVSQDGILKRVIDNKEDNKDHDFSESSAKDNEINLEDGRQFIIDIKSMTKNKTLPMIEEILTEKIYSKRSKDIIQSRVSRQLQSFRIDEASSASNLDK